jgi:hypothetical protein
LSAKLGAAEATLRGEKVSLTHRQVAALVGIWFRHELAEHGDNLGSDPEGWNLVPDDLLDRVAEIGGDGRPPDDYATALRPGDRDDAAALLAEHGFPAEPDAIARVRRALFDAKVLAAKILARRAGGDWQPDHSGARFPPASDVSPAASQQAISKGDGCTMDALLAGWVADHGCRIDAKPEPRALYDRRRTIERLPAFLGHRDADAVIKADALRGKEDMQKRGLHVSSIRNDISEMSAVWRWRMQNCKLHCATPFQGISPLKVKRRSRRVRPCGRIFRLTIPSALAGLSPVSVLGVGYEVSALRISGSAPVIPGVTGSLMLAAPPDCILRFGVP